MAAPQTYRCGELGLSPHTAEHDQFLAPKNLRGPRIPDTRAGCLGIEVTLPLRPAECCKGREQDAGCQDDQTDIPEPPLRSRFGALALDLCASCAGSE